MCFSKFFEKWSKLDQTLAMPVMLAGTARIDRHRRRLVESHRGTGPDVGDVGYAGRDGSH